MSSNLLELLQAQTPAKQEISDEAKEQIKKWRSDFGKAFAECIKKSKNWEHQAAEELLNRRRNLYCC
jgi:hypothetical protein